MLITEGSRTPKFFTIDQVSGVTRHAYGMRFTIELDDPSISEVFIAPQAQNAKNWEYITKRAIRD